MRLLSVAHLQKTKNRYKSLEKQGILDTYRNELDRACFHLYMAYAHFKHSARKTTYDRKQRTTQWVSSRTSVNGLQFFYKKVKWIGVYTAIKIKLKLSQQLADELHKPIIRNIKKLKGYLSLMDNIWVTGLADLQFFKQI